MPPRGHAATIRLVVLTVAVVACGCVASTPPSAPSPTWTPAPSSAVTPTATPTTAPSPGPSADTCVTRTLASMTEAQRIGQLFMIGLAKDRLGSTARSAIATSHFGSVVFTTQTAAGVKAIRAVTDAVQSLATDSATDRVGFLVAANQEGGLIQGLAGPGFDVIPSAMVQGSWTPAKLDGMAARWGQELRDAGINLDLAPVADVVPPGTDAQNAPIGKLKRAFGHDPATVSSHVEAFVAGMQRSGIATTVKHFPGLGRVAGNTDFTDQVRDPDTTLDDPFLEPFARAIDAGVAFTMVSLATYVRIDPGHLAVFSPAIVGSLLRGDLGFRGVVISDALGAKAVASIAPGTRAVEFLDAGGDMIISNKVAPAIEMAQAVAERVAEETQFAQRVDDAATRILRAKEALGLLACDG
jgi:beta-N-acetylhexosaminidase